MVFIWFCWMRILFYSSLTPFWWAHAFLYALVNSIIFFSNESLVTRFLPKDKYILLTFTGPPQKHKCIMFSVVLSLVLNTIFFYGETTPTWKTKLKGVYRNRKIRKDSNYRELGIKNNHKNPWLQKPKQTHWFSPRLSILSLRLSAKH